MEAYRAPLLYVIFGSWHIILKCFRGNYHCLCVNVLNIIVVIGKFAVCLYKKAWLRLYGV